MMFTRKRKGQNNKILQNALPRNFNIKKNVKIASASFCDCSPVQIFDSYVQILHSEDDSIKNRNSHGSGELTRNPLIEVATTWAGAVASGA